MESRHQDSLNLKLFYVSSNDEVIFVIFFACECEFYEACVYVRMA